MRWNRVLSGLIFALVACAGLAACSDKKTEPLDVGKPVVVELRGEDPTSSDAIEVADGETASMSLDGYQVDAKPGFADPGVEMQADTYMTPVRVSDTVRSISSLGLSLSDKSQPELPVRIEQAFLDPLPVQANAHVVVGASNVNGGGMSMTSSPSVTRTDAPSRSRPTISPGSTP